MTSPMARHDFRKTALFARFLVLWLAGFVGSWNLPLAMGVQTQLADSNANTTPSPTDDPGFANVGYRNANTGVYIGEGWVLTAGHVPGGDISFGSGNYPWNPSTNTVLRNPDEDSGYSEFADLRMYRLAAPFPPLPSLRIATRVPPTGAELVMAGNGRNREADLTYWRVTQQGQASVWQEVSSSDLPVAEQGYKYAATNTIRWGTNQVSQSFPLGPVDYVRIGNVDTLSFATKFDEAPGTSEAQAATNDSGGAVFLAGGTEADQRTWELAGIMHGVGTKSGQPGQTSVFGNLTYSAALFRYAPQITSRIEQGRSDTNDDGIVDGLDAAIVYAAWGTNAQIGDLNRDNVVDGADIALIYKHWTGDSFRGGGATHANLPEPCRIANLALGLGFAMISRVLVQPRLNRRWMGRRGS